MYTARTANNIIHPPQRRVVIMASSPCELRKRIQISVCEEQLKTLTRIPWFNTIKGWYWVSNVAGWKFEPHTDSEISGDIIFYYWSREGYPPKGEEEYA